MWVSKCCLRHVVCCMWYVRLNLCVVWKCCEICWGQQYVVWYLLWLCVWYMALYESVLVKLFVDCIIAFWYICIVWCIWLHEGVLVWLFCVIWGLYESVLVWLVKSWQAGETACQIGYWGTNWKFAAAILKNDSSGRDEIEYLPTPERDQYLVIIPVRLFVCQWCFTGYQFIGPSTIS